MLRVINYMYFMQNAATRGVLQSLINAQQKCWKTFVISIKPHEKHCKFNIGNLL